MEVVASTDCCFQEMQSEMTRSNAQVVASTDAADKRAVRAMKKRLQDRFYQRKHRAKREQQLRSLETDVRTLQTKIARLHRRKVAAAHAKEQRRQQQPKQQEWPIDSLQSHAKLVVTQFFQVYQNGYSLSLSGLQERFLRSVLDAEVEGADQRGVDAFVQQWRLYGQYFVLCELEPQIWKTQQCGDQSVLVVVDVMLYLRFNRQTIGILFPSLKAGRVDIELVHPLVTGTTAVAGTYTFVVGCTGCVKCLLVDLQLLETLRRILGTLERVVQLTDGSRMALDSGTISTP